MSTVILCGCTIYDHSFLVSFGIFHLRSKETPPLPSSSINAQVSSSLRIYIFHFESISRRIFEKNSPLENPGGFNTDFDPKTGLDSNDCHANARCPRKSSRVIFGIIITFEDGEDGARTTVFFIPLSNGNAGFYCTIESSFGFLSGSR